MLTADLRGFFPPFLGLVLQPSMSTGDSEPRCAAASNSPSAPVGDGELVVSLVAVAAGGVCRKQKRSCDHLFAEVIIISVVNLAVRIYM